MAGRPPLAIDQEQFEKLCSIHCTATEVAAWFRCSVDTIERWCQKTYQQTFAEIRVKKAEAGKVSLRRAMWQRALEGNVPLLIWLSKQHLGMTEKVEQKQETQISGQLLVPAMTKQSAKELLEKLRATENGVLNGNGKEENQ